MSIYLIALIVNLFIAKRTILLYGICEVILMGVGLRIKTILREKKMTIKQLSENSGIPLNTLYSITKRDSDRVDNVIILRIAAAMEVTPASLMGLTDMSWMTPEYFELKRKYETGAATTWEREEYREIRRAHGYDPDIEEKVHPTPPTDIDYLRSNAHYQLDELNDDGVELAADYISSLHSKPKFIDKVPPTASATDAE